MCSTALVSLLKNAVVKAIVFRSFALIGLFRISVAQAAKNWNHLLMGKFSRCIYFIKLLSCMCF